MSGSDHFDDRPKSNSTSQILNKISNDRDSIVDDLHNPNSKVRKKVDNERLFNDICYFIFMEELRINSEIIIYLQKMEELLYEESESYIYALSQKELHIINISIEKAQLKISEEQLSRLKVLNERINAMLEVIARTLKEYAFFISGVKEEIHKLETELKDIHTNFSDKWDKHFDMEEIESKFDDLQINIQSERFNHILKANQHQGFITFDKAMYYQLTQDVSKEIRAGRISLLNINDVVHDKAEHLLQARLSENLSFMSLKDRNELTREIMASATMQAAIADVTNNVITSAMNNPSLVQGIRRAGRIQTEVAERKAVVAIYERKRDHLLGFASELKNAADVANDLAMTKHDTNDSLMDKSLSSLELLLSNLSNESEKIMSKLDDKAMQCNLMLACGDDAINGLSVITNTAIECKTNVEALMEIKNGLPDLASPSAEKFDDMFFSVMEEMKTESELAKIQQNGKDDEHQPPSPSIR